MHLKSGHLEHSCQAEQSTAEHLTSSNKHRYPFRTLSGPTSDCSECRRLHKNSSMAIKIATIKPQMRTTKIPPMFSIPRPKIKQKRQHCGEAGTTKCSPLLFPQHCVLPARSQKHRASTVLLIVSCMTQMAERMPRNNCMIEDALSETMILQINSDCIGGKHKAICGQTKNRAGEKREINRAH